MQLDNKEILRIAVIEAEHKNSIVSLCLDT